MEQRGGPVSLFFQVYVGCGRGFPERPHANSSLCLSNARKWVRLAARVLLHHLDPPPALLRPLGVPSGGAVQWTQTHRAEALQRVPRSTQAGEVAWTAHQSVSRPIPWVASERAPVPASSWPPPLPSQSREGADHGQLPKDFRAPLGEDAVARSQLRLTLSACVLSTFGHVTSVPTTFHQQTQVRA